MVVFHVFKTAHMLQIAQHDLSCIQSLIDSHVRVFSSPCFTRSGFSSIRSFFSTNFFFFFVLFFIFLRFFSPLYLSFWILDGHPLFLSADTFSKIHYFLRSLMADICWTPASAGSVLLYRVCPSFRLSVSFLRISSLVFSET